MLLLPLVSIVGCLLVSLSNASAIKGYSDFAWNFYTNYSSLQDFQNSGISPFAIYTSLIYTSVGARLRSRIQIMKSFNTSRLQIYDMYKSFQNTRTNSELKYAVGVFSDNSIKLKYEYEQTLYNEFRIRQEKIDFQKKSSVEKINEWAKRNGAGTNSVMDARYIDPSMRMITVATVAMPTVFKYEFDNKLNKDNVSFYTSPNDPRNVTMMRHKEIYLKTTSVNGAPLLEIPYSNSKIALYLFMPCTDIGLFENQITAKQLEIYVNSMVLTKVSLEMPMFNITSKIIVNQILAELGIKQIFSERQANFNNMADSNQGSIHMSSMIHNVNLTVCQSGHSKASESKYLKKSNEVYPTAHLSFNRPFLFFVMDSGKSRILHFAGRYLQPEITMKSNDYYQSSVAGSTTTATLCAVLVALVCVFNQ